MDSRTPWEGHVFVSVARLPLLSLAAAILSVDNSGLRYSLCRPRTHVRCLDFVYLEPRGSVEVGHSLVRRLLGVDTFLAFGSDDAHHFGLLRNRTLMTLIWGFGAISVEFRHGTPRTAPEMHFGCRCTSYYYFTVSDWMTLPMKFMEST